MGTGDPKNFPFRDIAEKLGFRRWHLAGAVSFFDMDNDTYLDLVANGVHAEPELYRFQPNVGYVLTQDAALAKISNVPPGCVAADFNNDGFTDLYMTRAAWFSNGPNRMLKNDGGKGFVDITEQSGDAPLAFQNSCGASVFDYDRDGLVDLAVSGTKGGSVRLLKNMGNFVFKDVTLKAGIDASNPTVTVSVTAGDVNNDGHIDLFVNRFNPKKRLEEGHRKPKNALYMNQGDGTFRDEGVMRGVGSGTPSGFASWMFDYDNDGDLDILASNFAWMDETLLKGFSERIPWSGAYHGSALYRNDGTGHFKNIGQEVGFTPSSVMGAQFIDLDLDGDLDIFLGPGRHTLINMQPLFVYRNDGNDVFTNITPLDNPSFYGKFHGMAFADIDRDGDPDMFVNNGGVLLSDRFQDMFLENTTKGKSWIHLKLVGTKSNRDAIGSRVEVSLEGGRRGDRVLMQEVAVGQGFSSTNSPYLIFGLDDAVMVKDVKIRWPTGETRSLGPLAINQALVVTEGNEKLRRVY